MKISFIISDKDGDVAAITLVYLKRSRHYILAI